MKRMLAAVLALLLLVTPAFAAGESGRALTREEAVETLTAVHRPIGSDGERKAAQYLQRRFREMGYQVTTQTYTDDAGRKGTNVIAARSASGPDADILVFSAHHDSVPTAYGANDNASGVAALLFAAEALKDKRFAAGKTLAEAEFTSAEHFNHRRVERRYAARNPKRKTRLSSCLSFWWT